MAKTSSNSNRRASSSSSAKRTTGRARPLVPKAGVTKSGRRSYKNGGEESWY